MNKQTFDELCASYLGENVPPTPAAPKLVTTPSPNQPAQPTTNNQQQNVAPNSNQQQDPELLKAFETLTKHAANNQEHQKAILALQQLLAAQQSNATNQPA